MSKDVVVFIEQREGSIKKTSFEALSLARELATELGGQPTAVLIGAQVEGLCSQVSAYGATKIYTVEAPALAQYSGDGYAAALMSCVARSEPRVVLLAHTAMGKDLAPRVAALAKTGLVSDATSVRVADGTIECSKPVYAGKAYRTLRAKKAPLFISLRPNTHAKSEAAASAERIQVDAPEAGFLSIVDEILPLSSERVPLQEAAVIVSGGRGLKDADGFKLVEDLAAAFGPGGAAVGASRAVVDAGWRPHSEQVGQTGKVVSPTLYIALGISGAIQHLAGMSTAKFIVAVNKDKEAPIFKIANYGIVGDLFAVVPKMIEAIKAVKGK